MDHELQRALLWQLFELRAAWIRFRTIGVYGQAVARFSDPVRSESECRMRCAQRLPVVGLACDPPSLGASVALVAQGQGRKRRSAAVAKVAKEMPHG